jgi:hypothetical protein
MKSRESKVLQIFELKLLLPKNKKRKTKEEKELKRDIYLDISKYFAKLESLGKWVIIKEM